MFDKKDTILFKNFCQSVIYSLRPMDAQPNKIENGFIWCDDWRIIEILKYLFNGKEMYLEDPPPNRLKCNHLWSKKQIIEEAEKLIQEFQTAEAIIEHLKKERSIVYDSSGVTGNT